MQSKRIKTLIIQWALPTVLLMVILVGLLTTYKKQNSKVVDSFVESSIEQTGGTYSRNISAVLKTMQGVTDILAEMMEGRADENLFYLSESLDATKNSGSVFSIVYCDKDGNVVSAEADNVKLQFMDFDTMLQETNSFYSYARNDEFMGEEVILYVNPVVQQEEVQGYLVAYMSPEELGHLFKDGNSYGDEVFYAIVTEGGSVLNSFGGADSTTLLTDDFWNTVKQETTTSDNWNVFEQYRRNRLFSKIRLSKGEERRILYQFPIENTEWYLVMGLRQEYAYRMLDKIWNPMVGLLFKVGICLVIYLLIVLAINVTNRIRSSEQKRILEDRADTDQLTELNNKIATERKIREYMIENPDKQSVLFVVDVDNFKKINDTLGHAFGDEVLRNLGMRLRAMFRMTDIIGRIGGDEFIVFLKDIREEENVEREGRKLECFFQNFEVGEYVKYSVTASVGGAVFPRDADNFEDLYKSADRAVYTSKKKGKNRLSFYGKDTI